MTIVDQIIAHAESLPTLPGAVAQLTRLVNDESSSSVEFEKAIKPDPALTANLLKMANSAYFAPRESIVSVRQAITRLGLKRVFDVALSAGFARVIPKYLPGYRLLAADFWRHSLAVAVIAEMLTKRLGLVQPESIFTAGLLHDIGKLAVGMFLEDRMELVQSALIDENSTFFDIEKTLLGTTHAEVGGRLIAEWNLSPAIATVATFHHRPDDVDEDHQELVDLVHIANALAHRLGIGCDTGELKRSSAATSAERLGLRVQILESVASEATGLVAEMGKAIE